MIECPACLASITPVTGDGDTEQPQPDKYLQEDSEPLSLRGLLALVALLTVVVSLKIAAEIKRQSPKEPTQAQIAEYEAIASEVIEKYDAGGYGNDPRAVRLEALSAMALSLLPENDMKEVAELQAIPPNALTEEQAKRQEALGCKALELLPEEDRAEFYSTMLELMQHGYDEATSE